MITEVCDSAGDSVDGCDEQPCGGAFDGPFEVLGETAVPVQPGDGAFDDPAARQRIPGPANSGATNSGASIPNSQVKMAGSRLKVAHCLRGNGHLPPLPEKRCPRMGLHAAFASEDIHLPTRRDEPLMQRAGQDSNGMQGPMAFARRRPLITYQFPA